MRDFKELYENYGIRFCIFCEGIRCYGLSEEEKAEVVKVFEDVKELCDMVEFEGGIFKRKGREFVVVKKDDCVAVALKGNGVGVTYYRLKRALRDLK